MSLVLNEDQSMFRDAARRFAAERAPVSQLRALRDAHDEVGFSRPVWKEMADMGWAGVLIPEELGGYAFGFVGAGLIAEEIGRNLSATPFVSTAILGATALLRAGTKTQQESWLPRIAAGELIVALATDERTRHSPYAIATRVTGSDTKLHVGPRFRGEAAEIPR